MKVGDLIIPRLINKRDNPVALVIGFKARGLDRRVIYQYCHGGEIDSIGINYAKVISESR